MRLNKETAVEALCRRTRLRVLVTYFWMYGPQRERPCPMCTSMLGSFHIPSIDLEQRVVLAVIGRSPVARPPAFARERGWRNLKFYQCVGDDFAIDYRGLAADGSEWPALDVWKKDGNKVRHFWAGESGETADPGEDAHGAPDPTPLWTILDLTPGGRGTDWYPNWNTKVEPDASQPKETSHENDDMQTTRRKMRSGVIGRYMG